MSDERCGSCGGPDCRLRTDVLACCPECTHRSEYRRGWHDGYRAGLARATESSELVRKHG